MFPLWKYLFNPVDRERYFLSFDGITLSLFASRNSCIASKQFHIKDIESIEVKQYDVLDFCITTINGESVVFRLPDVISRNTWFAIFERCTTTR